MRDRIKKIMGWRPEAGLYAVCAVAMLLVLLYPLIRLAGYSVPWYDDYNYGRFAKTAMEDAPTLANAFKGAAECIRISWYAWQGTYGSILFMVLMPAIWGEEYYCLGPVFLIFLLAVSVFILIYVLLREILKSDRSPAVGIAAVGAAMAVFMPYNSQAGFYWYNGGIHYIGMHSLVLLLVAMCVKLLCSQKLWQGCLWAVAVTPLGFLVAGGNYVSCLQGMLVILSMAGVGCIMRRRQTFFMLPMIAVYVWGFVLNVSAPGNDKRAAAYEGWGMSPINSILYSFVEGAKRWWEFTGLMTVVFIALMLTIIFYIVKRTDFSFRLPGLVSLWSVCLYATGFTPSLYSMGHGGLSRTLNAAKLTWQMLLILNVVYWCGWICRKKGLGERMCRWWVYPLCAAAAFLVFWTEPNQAGSYSSYGAYYYIHTGEAYNFYQEYLARVELLKGEDKVVEFEPYHWRPWMICMGDLSDNYKDESNMAIATWYKKDRVICMQHEETE